MFSAPSCSVLIKKTPDDILVGHSTWHVYESMSYRMLKEGARQLFSIQYCNMKWETFNRGLSKILSKLIAMNM